jgi:hypothetical protein
MISLHPSSRTGEGVRDDFATPNMTLLVPENEEDRRRRDRLGHIIRGVR